MTQHITNVSDPKRPSAEATYAAGQNTRSWDEYCEWLKQFTVGPPKATASYTRAQLEGQGQVGLYAC